MLIGDPSLGFFPPAAPPPGVPGDLSTARATGNTFTPVGTKLKGLSAYGANIWVGGENDLRRYDQECGGPLSTVGASHVQYVFLNYPTITSAKISLPTETQIYWTNSNEYAYSAVIPFNNIASPSSIFQNTSFPSRIGTLTDMILDRYKLYNYMTDSSGKSVSRFDLSNATTPPFMDSVSLAAYGEPYCAHMNFGGTRLFVAVVKPNGRVVVVRFDLPTAYALAGATYHSTSPELNTGIVVPGGLALNYDTAGRDDAVLLIGDRDSRTIYEYSMSP